MTLQQVAGFQQPQQSLFAQKEEVTAKYATVHGMHVSKPKILRGGREGGCICSGQYSKFYGNKFIVYTYVRKIVAYLFLV